MLSSYARGLFAIYTGLLAVSAAAPAHAQVPSTEYAARRTALAGRIDSGVVVAFGGVETVSHWPIFFQLPAFYYLTGFAETDAALVMVKRNGAVTATMFVPSRTPIEERWVGARTRPAEMQSKFGMAGRDIAQLRPIVDSLAESGLPLYVVPDVETADYAEEDSLTRGARFLQDVRHGESLAGHALDRPLRSGTFARERARPRSPCSAGPSRSAPRRIRRR